MISTSSKNPQETTVGMGEIALGTPPLQIKAVVGSCIALAVYHFRSQKAVVAHIVLPDSAGRNGSPGKFADAAVPHMLELLKSAGVPLYDLKAKFAGGANMFGTSGPLQIGDANIEAVTQALRKAGIPIVGQDVGGTRGRRVTFDCSSGQMFVESPGQPTKTL